MYGFWFLLHFFSLAEETLSCVPVYLDITYAVVPILSVFCLPWLQKLIYYWQWDKISGMETVWLAEPPQALLGEILTIICQQNKEQNENRQQYVSVSLCQTFKVSLQVCAKEDVNKRWYLARLRVSLPAFGHSPPGPESLRMSRFHCKTEPSGHQRGDETVWRRRRTTGVLKGVNMIQLHFNHRETDFLLCHWTIHICKQVKVSFPGVRLELWRCRPHWRHHLCCLRSLTIQELFPGCKVHTFTICGKVDSNFNSLYTCIILFPLSFDTLVYPKTNYL